ncbi:MAG: hypothetical protein AAF670_10735 [Planctomycetota bacterium]
MSTILVRSISLVGLRRYGDRTSLFWLAVTVLLCGSSGCKVLTPRQIPASKRFVSPELRQQTQNQIEVGAPNALVDTVGWVVGIPSKVLLWDRRADNHNVSPTTLKSVADYLHTNHLGHVKVRANQYAPIDDFKRLTKNKTIAWPYRYTLGLASVATNTILPGRIFGGDNFNPYTQTINLYSDIPVVALHEGGHAKDFTRRELQGTYALAYSFVPLWHETIATQDTLAYLHHTGNRSGLEEANRILYPAYGTYVGSTIGNYFPAAGAPIYAGALVAGHLNGRALNRRLRKSPALETVAYDSSTAPPSHLAEPITKGSDSNIAIASTNPAPTQTLVMPAAADDTSSMVPASTATWLMPSTD